MPECRDLTRARVCFRGVNCPQVEGSAHARECPEPRFLFCSAQFLCGFVVSANLRNSSQNFHKNCADRYQNPGSRNSLARAPEKRGRRQQIPSLPLPREAPRSPAQERAPAPRAVPRPRLRRSDKMRYQRSVFHATQNAKHYDVLSCTVLYCKVRSGKVRKGKVRKGKVR